MGMGSAYSAGAGLVRDPKELSYSSLISSLSGIKPRSGGGGRSSGERKLDFEKEKYNDAKSRQLEIDNQYRAAHHGQMPSPYDEAENKRAYLAGESAKTRDFKAGEAQKTRDFKAGEAGKTRDLEREKIGATVGLKKADSAENKRRWDIENKRKSELYAQEQDKERRIRDHKDMMNSFMTGDPNGIVAWFVKDGPKDKDGNQRIPGIELSEDGQGYMVTWPGAPKPEYYPIRDKNGDIGVLGQKLQRLSPKYEFPKSTKEEAGIKKTRRGAGLSKKDLYKAATDYAENANGDYDTNYRDFVQNQGLSPVEGAGVAPPESGANGPVRTGIKDGRRVGQFADGSIRYLDTNEPVK